jgi:ABC-2 type transport system permease protein
MNPRGTFTLFWKEIHRFKTVWTQTLLAPVISNLLFLLVFGVALSIQPSPFAGVAYLTFLIPGLAAMGAMSNAVQNPMGSLIIAKFTNNIAELMMIPLKGWELCLAYVSAGILRGFLVAAVTVIVGMLFAPLTFAHPLLILVFIILLGGIFSALGSIIGIMAKEFEDASVVPTFILTPLMYLGGVFYSVTSLPPLFAKLSMYNPLFYMIDGFRYAFLGAGEAPIWLSLAVTAVAFALTYGIASAMFQKGYRLKT